MLGRCATCAAAIAPAILNKAVKRRFLKSCELTNEVRRAIQTSLSLPRPTIAHHKSARRMREINGRSRKAPHSANATNERCAGCSSACRRAKAAIGAALALRASLLLVGRPDIRGGDRASPGLARAGRACALALHAAPAGGARTGGARDLRRR